MTHQTQLQAQIQTHSGTCPPRSGAWTRAGALVASLFVANDNDFVPGLAGGNKFYVFALSDADLGATFQQQQIPEPKSLALMLLGLGAIGWVKRRNRAAASPT